MSIQSRIPRVASRTAPTRMRTTRHYDRTIVLTLAIACGTHLLAAPHGRFHDLRVPDATGSYYVVVYVRTPEGGKPTTFFTIAKRPPEHGRVTAWRAKWRSRGNARAPSIAVTDERLGSGKLPHAPLEVRVSSSGSGVVFLGRFGGGIVGDDHAITSVGIDGTIRFSKGRTELLYNEEEQKPWGPWPPSLAWYRGSWIDETSKEAILVATGGALRAVDLLTGKIRKPDQATIRRALAHPDLAARNLAFELAAERRMVGVANQLRRVYENTRTPRSLRLRAAVTLSHAGERIAMDFARHCVASLPPTSPDWRYAVENLPELLGHDAALAFVRHLVVPQWWVTDGRALDVPGTPFWTHAWAPGVRALRKIGSKSVPTLCRIAEHYPFGTLPVDVTQLLGDLGDRRALPTLRRMMHGANATLSHHAQDAAIRIAGADIVPDLLRVLREKKPDTEPTLSFFARHKEPRAAPLILDVLESLEGRDLVPSQIDAACRALRFQTGRSGTKSTDWRQSETA